MRKTKSHQLTKFFSQNDFYDLLFTIIIFSIMLTILSNPQKFTKGTISGLKLFFYSVLPGLFPFMLLTKLLTEIGFLFKVTSKFDRFTHKIFGTPGVSLYVFLMSIISGYPIGAKIITDLYSKQLISEKDAKKMSVFCTTSGPIFVVGAVGSLMFGNLKIGLILYFSHIISSIIIGIIYHILTQHKTDEQLLNNCLLLNNSKHNIISKCVTETINSLFIVGAYITIFYLITEILDYFKIISFIVSTTNPIFERFGVSQSSLKGFIYGIIEVTRGAKELSSSISSTSIALCSGVISWSGFSIIMQSLAFLKVAKIKARTFLFFKCVHSLLSILLCFILLIIF